MPLSLSTFRCDVTPPIGHPLCGGWIPPAAAIADPLWANGLVLTGEDGPIVLVALDWCEIRNAGHDRWRAAIASAAGTTPDRVALQCVHPHDAPFADPEAEALLRAAGGPGTSLDVDFFEAAAARVASTARAALARCTPVTHVGIGQARVEQVASNRRIRGPDGRVGPMRGSSCRDPVLRAAPEGLVDPWLKAITFWQGDRLLAGVHVYATHPMSHYGKGEVSCDFCGLARDRLAEETGAPQLYFTGAAGNIGAGKYNDGSPEMRPVLTERVLAAMREALAATECRPASNPGWSTEPVRLPTRPEFTEHHYRALLEMANGTHLERYRGATGLAWLGRVQKGHVIDFACLAVADARLLFLPGEPFVEYQLFAHAARPDRFVALAGYGDCGPGYLPTRAAFDEGGYEAGWAALVATEAQAVLESTISRMLLRAG